MLFKALRPRGDSARFLPQIKNDVKTLFNKDQPSIRRNNQSHLILFALTFFRHVGVLNRALNSSFLMAQQALPPLQQFKKITADRRNRNLKDMLLHNQLNPMPLKNLDGRFKQVRYIENIISKRGLPIGQSLSQYSTNVIYAIQCTHCKMLYMGETGNSIRT